MTKEALEYTVFSFSDTSDALPLLPSRPSRSCKGDFGRVLCICGSYGMAGAAYLCAKSAYRAGAGLVEIFTHESNRIILQTLLPEAIISTYNDQYSTNDILPSLEKADCIAIGCGLGTTHLAKNILSDTLRNRSAESNIILDADALNILSKSSVLLKYAKGCIITPHAKEISRLCGLSIEEILASPADVAYYYAKKHNLVCLLKDHQTVVSDGSERLYKNNTGNSGMATGGSGDVLAGIVAGLWAQRKKSYALDTAALAAYIHGLCGDLASQRLTEYCVTASDLIEELPNAYKAILS